MNNSEKLDKILYFMGSTEQHFKELNGSVKRHQEQFVIEEKKLTEICKRFDTKVVAVEKIALGNQGKLLKWSGTIIGLSVVIPILSCLATLKVLGVI